MIKFIFKFLCFCFILSCTHNRVHLLHVGGGASFANMKKYPVVTGQATQKVILGIASETDYADRAYEQILEKCSGNIQGLTTQFSTKYNFYSWTNKILIRGFCIQ